MFQFKIVKTFLPFILLAVVGYFSYRYFLKDFYWNNQTQMIHLEDLSIQKVLKLKKHKAQNNIYSLEFELKGRTDQNIYILFGASKDQLNNQIMIKKGKIDLANVVDWYQDDCYMLITSEENASLDLDIDYRFIGTNK